MISFFYQKRIKIQLIRPLLSLNRLEILKLSSFWLLPIYIDPTNKLFNFRRNRLRHQIFPILRVFFNPKIDNALLRFIETINLDKNYFNSQLYETKNFFKIQKIKSLNSGVKNLESKKFFTCLPINLQKKIYKQLLILHFKNITFNEIESLLQLNILI